MILGQKGVKYGLQVRKPEKTSKSVQPKPNIFGDEASDSEEDNVEKKILRHAARKQSDKQVAEMHAAALAEDPSVFDYDSHFDTIQESRAEPKRKEKTARESKYIASLLETAEERKREQAIQYERQLSKERAAEDHLFGDKERFVTAAYKKKLEEEEKWKLEQKEKQEREERNAVEKVGHMGDFYRNILRNNVAFGTATTAAPPLKSGGGGDGDGGKKEEESRTDGGEDDIMPERRAEMNREAVAAAALKKNNLLVGEEERARVSTTTAAGAAAPIARENRRDERIEATAAVEQGVGVSNEEGVKKKAVDSTMTIEGRKEPLVTSQKSREDAVAAAKERYLARKRKAPVNSTSA